MKRLAACLSFLLAAGCAKSSEPPSGDVSVDVDAVDVDAWDATDPDVSDPPLDRTDGLDAPDVPDVTDDPAEEDVFDAPDVADLVEDEEEAERIPVSVDLTASADTRINQRQPTTNYGTGAVLNVRNNDGSGSVDNWARDVLVEFDLSSIPSTATIVSATLRLYYYSWVDTDPAGRTLDLYALTGAWTETTVTWDTQPTRSSTSSATATVPTTVDTWMDWDVTADVQDFVSGTSTNNGWILRDEVAWGSSNIPVTRFRAREYGSEPPTLVVVY
jgi:hypothetical protein